MNETATACHLLFWQRDDGGMKEDQVSARFVRG